MKLSFLLIITIIINSLFFLGCKQKENKVEIIEMFPNNDYIIFDAQVNDKQGYFLFDTHSAVNVIFKKPWDTFVYNRKGKAIVNNVEVEMVNIDSIKFGSAKYYDIEAVIIDDSNDTFKNMSGIIGFNIDQKANWILDFENGIVEIHKKKLEETTFDFALKYKVTDNINRLPYLNAELNDQKINLKIDTGYENQLKITQKDFFSDLSLDFESTNSASVFGRNEKKTAIFILDTLKISDTFFTDVKTEYVDDENKEELNLLGIQFFRQFRKIGIDTKRKNIYFKEYSPL